MNNHFLPAPPLPSHVRGAIISLCLCTSLPTQFLSTEVEVSGHRLPSHCTHRPLLLLARRGEEEGEARDGLGPRGSVSAPAHHFWPAAPGCMQIKPEGPTEQNCRPPPAFPSAPSGLVWKSAAQTGPLLWVWGWGRARLSGGPERKQRRGWQGSKGAWPVSRTGTGRYEEKATISAWSRAVLGLVWPSPACKRRC